MKAQKSLPQEVPSHPLHPSHPLKQIPRRGAYICDGCADKSCDEYSFSCQRCDFNLDVKCALLTDGQEPSNDGSKRKPAIHDHLIHKHKLNHCNIREPFADQCVYCENIIRGSAYACFDCHQFFIHESCYSELPRESLPHPFHPQHPLLPHAIELVLDGGRDSIISCNVCVRPIKDFGFCCQVCNFNIHATCINIPIIRPFKHESHDHDLFYFGDDQLLKAKVDWLECSKCNDTCIDSSLYRCVQCGANFHLECFPLPDVVKHESHDCQLTLLDSIKGHRSLDYHCDICEEKGNPKHHVYYCDDCKYIAHIDCVISEDDSSLEILSYLKPRCKRDQSENERIKELDKEIAQLEQKIGKLESKLLKLTAVKKDGFQRDNIIPEILARIPDLREKIFQDWIDPYARYDFNGINTNVIPSPKKTNVFPYGKYFS